MTNTNIAASDSLKSSLRKKDITNTSKDYLDRILNLNIYSYIRSSSDLHDSNKIKIGTLNSDILNSFNGNALSQFKFISGFVCPTANPSTCQICTVSNDYIYNNIDTLLFYHILAFQSFVNETRGIQTSLQSTMNNLVSNLSTTETNQINALQNTITSQASQIAALQASITALQNQQTLNTNNIQVISTKLNL
jgi:hypothetical protein